MVLPCTAAVAAAAGPADAAAPAPAAPAAAGAGGGRTIQEGDLVIVYESFQSMKHIYVDPKAQFQNRYGCFNQKDWIGKPFGSKVLSKAPGQGWVHLLAPNPELWTITLKHRTQILYVGDISLVVAHLQLKPGCVVLESGTGSGSLTHSLARAVAPTGHVYTFDFHALRAQEAAAEFKKHRLEQLITVQQRDIEEQGFPQDQLAGRADAVFLDLPGPWKVVASAGACLKPGGRFCSFSPCIEQVQRTCEALDQTGFTDIVTLELLLRGYEVTTESFNTDAAASTQPNKSGKKRSRGQAAAGAAAAGDADQAAGADSTAAAGEGSQQQQQQYQQVMTRPSMDARGHTGYLTFAYKFVSAVPIAGGQEADSEEGGGAGEEEAAGEQQQQGGSGKEEEQQE